MKTNYSNASPEVRVAVDRARAADLGVRMSTVGNALRLMVSGDDEISTYREGAEQYPVKIRVLESQRRDIETIGKLTCPRHRRRWRAAIRDRGHDHRRAIAVFVPDAVARAGRVRAIEQAIVGDKVKAWLGKVSSATVGRLRPAPVERT